MEDQTNPLHDLPPAQVAEYARHRLLEVEYWQHVLEDAGTINDSLQAVAAGIAEGTAHCLRLLLVTPAEGLPHLKHVITSNTAAMSQARALEHALQRLIDLAEGRGNSLKLELDAIRAAAGLEPIDGADEAEQ